MPRKCTICAHPDREKIDQQLASGASIRATSALFRVSEDAAGRHMTHLSKAVVKAAERKEENLQDSILNQIKRVQEKLWEVLAKMESERDHRGMVVACREIRESLECVDRILTRTNGGPTEQQIFAEITERMRAALARRRQLPPAADVTVEPTPV